MISRLSLLTSSSPSYSYSVGRRRMLYWRATSDPHSSMSILRITNPPVSSARSSNCGPSCLHAPHQSAVNSITVIVPDST